MSKRINVYKPLPKHGHKGDTFREIIDVWEQKGYVNILPSPDRYCWWGKPGTVLLHDHPQVFDVSEKLPDYTLGVFGNEMPSEDRRPDVPHVPWIFWARNPKVFWKFIDQKNNDPRDGITPVDSRYWKSIFVGKVENPHQQKMRFQSKIDWTKHIDFLFIVKGAQTPYPFAPDVYLELMNRSKFALLLPGYGPKCNRDVEALGCGAIPIVTPGVCTNYYEPLVENEHYLRLESEEDFEKIVSTDSKTLTDIQKNGQEWYKRNCSPEGSFETTKRIVEENS